MNLKNRKQELDIKFQDLEKKRIAYSNEIEKIQIEQIKLNGAYGELTLWEKGLETSLSTEDEDRDSK